jgi:hypothetical protein
MRSTNVILFFVLFAVSAYSFDLSSFVELGEIKNDPVGKSFLSSFLPAAQRVALQASFVAEVSSWIPPTMK